MRLVASLYDQNQAQKLADFLTQKQIVNQLEVSQTTDWGNANYGVPVYTIWILEEEHLKEALEIVRLFFEDPHHERFEKGMNVPSGETQNEQAQPSLQRPPIQASITRFILATCCFLFFVGIVTEPLLKVVPPPQIPAVPLYSPPVNKALMYDYPHAYELIDQLVHTYGLDAMLSPQALPEAGQQQLDTALHTPYWRGFYKLIVDYLAEGHPIQINAPMFEKIRAGEIWRFFTSILLHSDIFHLFFNMVWLVVLGRQIEQHIGRWRYLLFIAITALIPNTAQYLMSGANFVGISGVLCAMLTFIWWRQKVAAWEGYQLEKGTIAFIAFFIFLMLALQIIAFFFELQGNHSFTIGIANTAHLVGGFVGWLLARMHLFAWKK